MANNKDKNTSKNSDSTQNPSRRKFIKNSGIAAGGVVGGTLLGGYFGDYFNTEEKSKTQKEDNTAAFLETRSFFKRKEDFDVLNHAVECIFPEDDNGPGAIKLGVPNFIDKQLAGPWGYNKKMYMKKPFQKNETPLTKREMFLQGVRKINEVSQKEYDEDFVDLDEDEQVKILESFEKDDVKMKNLSSNVFFETLKQSTLEGAYSDPMYGGNKNMNGWVMKEYPGPQMSYRDNFDDGFEEFKKLDRKSMKDNM